MPTIAQIARQLDRTFPLSRAESWDKVGLLIGDEHAEVSRVFVAYEVTAEVVRAAQEANCDLILAYHPLIFRPLDNLNFKNHTARLCGQILAARQSLYCLHTALDGAPVPNALGDALARQLGLEGAKVWKPSARIGLVKIITFVPPENLEEVCAALWGAGAGEIGRYDEASFQSAGTGTFRPLEGADPHIGEVGERAATPEIRLEVIAPQDKWKAIVAAMVAAHPYEEVAYDVVALLNQENTQNYGPLRLAEVEAAPLEHWIERAKSALGVPEVRIAAPAGFNEAGVKYVACSPGSGASFIDSLPPQTCFITGDIKHHDALKAIAQGIAIIDVTHAATETTTIELMAQPLQGMDGLEIVKSQLESNPFRFA